MGEPGLVDQAEVRGQAVGEPVLHQYVVDHCLGRVVRSDLYHEQRDVLVGKVTLDLDDDGSKLLTVECEGRLSLGQLVLLSPSLHHRLGVGQTPLQFRLLLFALLWTGGKSFSFLLLREHFLHADGQSPAETFLLAFHLPYITLHLGN